MNVTVNRAEFLAAAKRAASVAPLSSPLEPLRGILLETDRREGCLTISATNLEVSLVQTIPCTSLDADALVLNARLLEGMLDKLEGDSVTLIRVEQQPVVLLTSGLAAYRIGVWERGIFPQIESPYPADTRPGHWNPRYDQAHYICGGREEKYAPAALRKPHVYAERPESGGQQRKLCGQREGGQPEYRQHQLACAGIFSGQAGPHV